jgi:hypothetical protein
LDSIKVGKFDRLSDYQLFKEYGLNDRGSKVLFPVKAGNFSLHHRVQNSYGAHPASYPGALSLGGKAAEV